MRRVLCAAAALLLLVCMGCTSTSTGSYTMVKSVGNSGNGYWNDRHAQFDGHQQKTVTMPESAVVSVEIETESGSLNLSITGPDDTVYYTGADLPTSAFQVDTDGGKVTVRVEGTAHKGSFAFTWE